MSQHKWSCPDCRAPQNRHGVGVCRSDDPATCEGLICHCASATRNAPDHGEGVDNRCLDARCDHCDWMGAMPKAVKTFRRHDLN